MALQHSIEVYLFRTEPHLGFLLLKRRKAEGGFWQPITGRVEPRERLDRAALREVQEETGITRHKRLIDLDFTFRFNDAGQEYLEHCFGMEVDSDVRPSLGAEHVAFRWVGYEEAMKLLRWRGNKRALIRLQTAPMH